MSDPIYVLGRTRMESKARLFGILGYEIHADPVLAYHTSGARHLIARAPARTSKSFASAPELVHSGIPLLDPETMKPALEERTCWAVGIDYSTLKEWEYLYAYLSSNDFELIRELGGRVTQKYNSPNAGNLRVVVEWGQASNGRTARTIWAGKSSANETSLQGEEVLDCVLSEAAEHDQRVVEKYLLTRCSRIMYPTTPKKKALWLFEMAEAGAADPSLGIEEIKFTRDCNPTYDFERYEAAKRKSIATYGAVENDPEFLEQFEGEWVFHEGKVLPFRWMDMAGGLPSHVVDDDPHWIGASWHLVSMDYGYTDHACALLWAIGPEGQLCIRDEVYEQHLSNQEFVDRVQEMCAARGVRPRLYVPDPQKPELTKLVRQAGLPVFSGMNSATLRDRAAGAMALVDALSTDPAVGEPRLHVHKRCARTIHEWKRLHRKAEVADQWSASALVGADHAFDSARYGIMAIGKRKHYDADTTWIDRIRQAERKRAHEATLRRRNVGALVMGL